MIGGAAFDNTHLEAYVYDMFSDLHAPRTIGQRYLEIYPQEADKRELSNFILAMERPQDLNAFRRILQVRRSEDFQVENIVIIDGWILSRTEARLYALTRLL
jgi:hypothetical protein